MQIRTKAAAKQTASTPQRNRTQEILATIDQVGLLFGGGSTGNASTGNAGTGTTGSASTPAAPAPSTGPSVDVQTLLLAIPIASDGQVITAEYHNSLRAAIIGIANQMGVGLSDTGTTFTFAPTFLAIGTANWALETTAFTAQAGAAADGWLPVQLPDGQSIQSLTVNGKMTGGTPTSFQVILCREPVDPDDVAKTGADNLITIDLSKTPAGSFTVSGAVAAGSGANALDAASKLLAAQAAKLIDNVNYKYFVRATLKPAAGVSMQAEIDAIQISVGS